MGGFIIVHCKDLKQFFLSVYGLGMVIGLFFLFISYYGLYFEWFIDPGKGSNCLMISINLLFIFLAFLYAYIGFKRKLFFGKERLLLIHPFLLLYIGLFSLLFRILTQASDVIYLYFDAFFASIMSWFFFATVFLFLLWKFFVRKEKNASQVLDIYKETNNQTKHYFLIGISLLVFTFLVRQYYSIETIDSHLIGISITSLILSYFSFTFFNLNTKAKRWLSRVYLKKMEKFLDSGKNKDKFQNWLSLHFIVVDMIGDLSKKFLAYLRLSKEFKYNSYKSLQIAFSRREEASTSTLKSDLNTMRDAIKNLENQEVLSDLIDGLVTLYTPKLAYSPEKLMNSQFEIFDAPPSGFMDWLNRNNVYISIAIAFLTGFSIILQFIS